MASEPLIAIVVYILAAILIIANRKRFEIEKLANIPMMFLYRTKKGINTMKKLAKHAWLWKILATIAIPVAIFWMIQGNLLLYQYGDQIVQDPSKPPGAQLLIPGFNLPLLSGIIAIIVLALIHEFSHGITAFAEKIKVKNAGFGFLLFLPMIPVAFVEPDEKSMKKSSRLSRLRVLSAGSFANLIAFVLFLGLSILYINSIVIGYAIPNNHIDVSGVTINQIVDAPINGTNLTAGAVITQIDDTKIENISSFSNFMNNTKPNQAIMLRTSQGKFNLALTENLDTGSGYLGVIVEPRSIPLTDLGRIILFGSNLLFWLYLLNFAIAIINFMPVFGITDGCRIVYEIFGYLTKNIKIQNFLTIVVITFSSLLLIFNLIGPYLLRYI
jgi:membrane-associated protease RseP (regulator of RpoE activity)